MKSMISTFSEKKSILADLDRQVAELDRQVVQLLLGITMDNYWTTMGQLWDNYWITIIVAIYDEIDDFYLFGKKRSILAVLDRQVVEPLLSWRMRIRAPGLPASFVLSSPLGLGATTSR